MSRSPALAVVTAVAALSLSACGFFSGTDSTTGGGSSAGGAAPKTVLVPPPGTILSSNSTKQLGTTVVDGSLNTLYRFDRDSAEPPTATCVDACAEAWPPLLTDSSQPTILEGLEEGAVGTVTRPDGSTQVTIGGWPVYRHAEDSAPGATDGNGVDGAWFAIKPDGRKAGKPQAAN
jgi:predicted lipoprotein with Yx(FWY)xxD motif